MARVVSAVASVVIAALGVACSSGGPGSSAVVVTSSSPPPATDAASPPSTSPTTTAGATTTASEAPATTTESPATTTTSEATARTTTTESSYVRPEWLGTRLLPLRPDGRGEAQPTPDELVDRQLETIDLLPPPAGDTYVSTIGPVPGDVVARSTWEPDCPVSLDELSYLTMTFWGFDGEHHTGEMIVNAEWADEIVEIFGRLHAARFPIEQMRVVTRADLDAHPTGDSNNTTGYVCRPAVGSSRWSNHAFGLAVDINPFHNPYEKGDLILPELAEAYLDRSRATRGMLLPGDVVVRAFADIGWGWGGNWSSLLDYMHFSHNGR